MGMTMSQVKKYNSIGMRLTDCCGCYSRLTTATDRREDENCSDEVCAKCGGQAGEGEGDGYEWKSPMTLKEFAATEERCCQPHEWSNRLGHDPQDDTDDLVVAVLWYCHGLYITETEDNYECIIGRDHYRSPKNPANLIQIQQHLHKWCDTGVDQGDAGTDPSELIVTTNH